MEHRQPKLILQCIILFEFLAATVHGIICHSAAPESYNSWPTEFSGSANLFQFRPPNAVNVSCVTFLGTRVQNVLQMEFNCDETVRKLLEPILADFGKHDAFGVRSWNPLLVEACTGAADQDDLGPVGLEQNPTLAICATQTPSPNCSYRVDVPIAYNSFFVSLGNKTTPYTTWYESTRVVRPATRAQNVLQLEFHCNEEHRSQLEPILTDLRRTEAFGLRRWNPLLVEACSGKDVQDALGPVGVEQSPLVGSCTFEAPRPDSTFRLDIPLAHDSFCVGFVDGKQVDAVLYLEKTRYSSSRFNVRYEKSHQTQE
ncbi:hypothetical protein pipiens_015517 [Culex pipiens pipiens]|uniref:Uncharacterized protein n=1 Tax=Culex pipiens pipiens TaxID=38569 RepID=A0ABD1CQ65_CULPP